MRPLTCPACSPSPYGAHQPGCRYIAALRMGIPWWAAVEAVCSAALDEESDVHTRKRPNEAPAAASTPGGVTTT